MACMRHPPRCGASLTPRVTRSVAFGYGRAGGPIGGHLSFRSLLSAGPEPTGLACTVCSHTKVFKWLCFLRFLTPVCIIFQLFFLLWLGQLSPHMAGSVPFSGEALLGVCDIFFGSLVTSLWLPSCARDNLRCQVTALWINGTLITLSC